MVLVGVPSVVLPARLLSPKLTSAELPVKLNPVVLAVIVEWVTRRTAAGCLSIREPSGDEDGGQHRIRTGRRGGGNRFADSPSDLTTCRGQSRHRERRPCGAWT